MSKSSPKSSKPYIEVKNLIKNFGAYRAIDNISFSAAEGTFLTLLGPSGCGKTTTLMSIAGLHNIDSGEIVVGNTQFTVPQQGIFLPPERRDIGMVFQNYAIWPHMTVAQNVAYPLEIRKVQRDEIDARVADILELVGLSHVAGKVATNLSGGQQQRTALARAIVSKPRLLLFDEPLSNLDLKLREQMRAEIKRVQQEVGITSVFVTHDQSEALVMSDEIIVMGEGHIQQRGKPREIYSNPQSAFVSNFIGTTNLLKGRVTAVTTPGFGHAEIVQNEIVLRLPCRLGEGLKVDSAIVVSVRPENIRLLAENEGGDGLDGEVTDVIFFGNWVDCRVRSADREWKVMVHPRAGWQRGDKAFLYLDPEHTLAIQA